MEKMGEGASPVTSKCSRTRARMSLVGGVAMRH
jgi:hypothetical protein